MPDLLVARATKIFFSSIVILVCQKICATKRSGIYESETEIPIVNIRLIKWNLIVSLMSEDDCELGINLETDPQLISKHLQFEGE